MCPGDDCAFAQRLPFASAIDLLEEKKKAESKKFMKLLKLWNNPPELALVSISVEEGQEVLNIFIKTEQLRINFGGPSPVEMLGIKVARQLRQRSYLSRGL